jgi:phage terminase large subunit-like protein
VLCAIEFVGPCRVTGELTTEARARALGIPAGQPIGHSHPQAWVQTAAVSKEQTRNTMTLFPTYFTKAALAEYEIDLGKEIIYAHHGAQQIQAVTSSPRTLEGARSTFVLRNETHHWLSSNEGHEMDAVIDRNLTKAPDGAARALSITNAYEPGEESVAQLAREAYENIVAGRAVDVGFLYDSLEAPPEATLDPKDLPAELEAIRGDAIWLDIPRVIQGILDKRNPPSRSRRFWLNQIVATEDAWVTPQEWDALADRTPTVEEGELVALGFDGSLTDDHSALIGCRISDGYLFTLGVWDPARTGNEAPRGAIDRAVRAAFEHYDVVAFFSDLHPWESYVDRWALELGGKLCAHATSRHKIAWDMRARQKEFTLEGAERTHNEITEQALKHDGDARVRQHVHNARRRPNAWGVAFGKEHRESSRKVDSLAALILARMARRAYLALPKGKQRRQRQRAAFF